ncbi:MAG TPA: oxaloacetate decarboxylase subunit alpha, partial [Clostridium sp.]|nr:oxaloacetate decarboxylase subunit alpha [Clostridium sp.]
VMGVDINTLIYQVPGGMLSNLVSQLKQSNALDKFEEVLKEIPKVREDFGFPPLVTPTSQIVGTQAVLNVLMGERYKNVSKEVKAYIKGEYGKTPGEIDDELMKKVLGDEKPIAGRFAETLPLEFDKIKEEVKDFAKTDEDVLSYILFPQIAEKYLKEKDRPKTIKVSYSIRKA